MKAFSVILAATLVVMVSGQDTALPGQEPFTFQNPGEITPGVTFPYLINAVGGIWQQQRVIDSLAYTCTDVLSYIGSIIPEVDSTSMYWGQICDRVVEGSNNFEAFDATGFCDGIITMVTNLTMSNSDGRIRRQAVPGQDDPLDITGILINITKDLYDIDINVIINDPSMISTICTNVKENFLRPSLPDLISQFGTELLSALLPQAAPLCQEWDGFLQSVGINSTSPYYMPIQEAARIASQAAGYNDREALCEAINQALSVQGDGGEARKDLSMNVIDSVFDIPKKLKRCSMLGNDLIDDFIEPILNVESSTSTIKITTDHIYNATGFQGVNPLCNAVEIAFTTIVDLPDPVPAEIIPGTTLTVEFFINAAGGAWLQPRTIDSLYFGCTDIIPGIESMVPEFSNYSRYYEPVCSEIRRAATDLDAFDATTSCNNLTDLITDLSSMDSSKRARRQAEMSRGIQDYMAFIGILSNISRDLYGIDVNNNSTICPNIMQFLEPSVPDIVTQFIAELIGRMLSIADYHVCQDWTVYLPSVGIPTTSPYYQVILDAADLGSQMMGFDDRDDFCMAIDQAMSGDERRSIGRNAIDSIIDIFTNVDRCVLLANDVIDIIEPVVSIEVPGFDMFEVSSYLLSRYTGFVGVEEVCRAMETAFTMTCPAVTLMTDYGSVAMFESGAINDRANSTDTNCPFYTTRGGQPIEAVCEGDYIRPCNWVIPDINCGLNLTTEEILRMLQDVEVTSDNVAIVANDLADISTFIEDVPQDDLNTVVELLEGITGVNSTDMKVTVSVVKIADNFAGLPEEQLEIAEEENSGPSRVVLALEAQLAVVELNNGSSRFIETNVAAEVLYVSSDDISNGYTVFMSVTDDSESISDDDFKVNAGDRTQEAEATGAEATLFIPSGLADQFEGHRGRLIITTYSSPSLFQDRRVAELNQYQTEFNRTVNSRIISASINNKKVEDLREPVRISLTPVNPNATNAQCVFWDFDEKKWSGRGCVKTSNDSTDRIECECNHLTNFGILMDIYGGKRLSDEADFILQIITYAGCCMSILGLIITILTYATNKKLRERKPNKILLSLSSALLGLYIVFLVMISVNTERDVAELLPIPCSILAAFLHYFVLASIFWMGVEGYNMHNLFVKVLNTYMPMFMRKASLFAWGVPLLIVGITAGVSRQYYALTDICFLSFWPLIGGLLIPVGIIMIFNLVIFIRVLTRLNKTVKGKQLDKTEKRERIRRFQNAVCIMLLMGLTWSVGYLSIIEPASALVQGVFTVLNSLQGCFIFMLYCVRQPQVRKVWRSKCCLPKSFRAPSTINSSSGQTDIT